tara:strand:+ start:37751 stop:38344 length:594 start_codon:yes stop_codon:yes gene_type:complete
MDDKEKIEIFYAKEQPFKEGINTLRNIILETELEEAVKWGAPIYTIENKNILGIMAFKNHFGLWFFNGSLLKDPNHILENAQEGKTKYMRHWKFASVTDIDKPLVLKYVQEAIENQKKEIVHKIGNKKPEKEPLLFKELFLKNKELEQKFQSLPPYKQKEYFEYINSAKQEKTKGSRLEKCILLLEKGIGLNDAYRS